MELTIDQALQQGVAAHKEGKLQEAERLYRAILQTQPTHPDANHNLGVLAASVNKTQTALPLLKTALDANPNQRQFWLSYIDALIKGKQFENAKEVLDQGKKRGLVSEKVDALEAQLTLITEAGESKLSEQKKKAKSPSQTELNTLLEHYQNGRYDDAEKLAISITQEFPNQQFSWKVLGEVFKKTGRISEALVAIQQSVALAPEDAEAHSNLGITLRDLGRLEEAEASYRQAISLKPDFVEAHSNLGNTLRHFGRQEEAEASYRQAISLKPDYAEAHSNLGNTLRDLGRLEDAEANYRQAISLKPDYAEAHSNLGNTLRDLSRLEEAEASYRQAISLKPDLVEAHSNLGNTLRDLGRLEEAEASYRQAISLKPHFFKAHSNLLFLQSSYAFDSALHLKEALNYANAISKKVSSRFAEWSCVKKPQRLRIGLVSGDFKNHPVGYFLEGLLTQLNPSSVELFAYPTHFIEDELTTRIKPRFASWTPLFNKSDKAAAQLIHNDGVHILIDLSGHTANNRLPIFAWKPAPIQISWLGYWATTGVPEIDYVLGDPHVTPYDEANHFIEKIWQLPESFVCLTEPNVTLEVKPLPALSIGTITFGCFNNLAKMTEEVVALRAKVLKAASGSKLFLKAKQLGVASRRDVVLERFSRHGITADRLILEGRSPWAEYLASYNRMDIALSPFPYGGVTTSAEGLWMGVPVLTKRGDRFLSHVGETIAHNAGLSDWIAADEDEYIAKAVAFSSDLKGLAKLRAGLRGQLLSSPLFNSSRFANHFEKAVWSMWELWEEEKIAL